MDRTLAATTKTGFSLCAAKNVSEKLSWAHERDRDHAFAVTVGALFFNQSVPVRDHLLNINNGGPH